MAVAGLAVRSMPRDCGLRRSQLGPTLPGRNRSVNRATHYIAKYWYGLYLGQVPVLWVVFVQLRDSSAVLKWLLFLILIVLVPVLSYHLIEEPFIKVGAAWNKRASRQRQVPAPGEYAANTVAP